MAFLLVSRGLGQGSVDLQFADRDSGQAVSARIRFTKPARKVNRPKKLLAEGDQWLVEENVRLALPNGEFEFQVERGPEFNEIKGGFTIEPRAKDVVSVDVPRSVDMHAEHWYSGDHLSSLPRNQLRRWQMADAVDFAVSTAPAPESPEKMVGNGVAVTSELAQWPQGSVLFHGENARSSEHGSLTDGVRVYERLESQNEDSESFAELLRPWTRDVPLLLANPSVRSVQLLSGYNRPAGDDRLMVSKDRTSGASWRVSVTHGKEKLASEVFAPIDKEEESRFRDARGLGKLSEYIYWQMLEAGLRLTPTAGSGFPGAETQIGYNRVYVFSENQANHADWWRAILAGKTMVTNGPLLRASVNGMSPGSIQASYRGQPVSLDIAANLAVREPVDYLDVIFNGETLYSAKLEDHFSRGEFPSLEIDRSGWLVIRVVTERQTGYCFATTAPFYFEFDGKPRVSRRAVLFFQHWLKACAKDLESKPDELQRYGPWLDQAEVFWQSRLHESNSE